MKKLLFAALAATTLFAACNKDGGEGTGNVPDGEATKMGLSFTFPGMIESRAVVDDNASVNEKKVKDVTVFIFKSDGTAATGNGTTVAISKFTETADNLYTLNADSKIATTTGTKRIYVGMNLPDDMKAFTTESTLSTAMTVDMAKLVTTDGTAMFSTAVKEQVLTTVEADNMVPVTVERLVAKIAASYKTGFNGSNEVGTTNKVTYTVTKYGVGQDGTKMFPSKKVNGSKLVTPGDRSSEPANAGMIVPNAAGTPVNGFSGIYAGENASIKNLRGEVTYAVFQATFVPEKVAKKSGNDISLVANPNLGAATMYVINSDEGVYFCETLAERTEILELNKLTNPTIQNYPDGYCYYFIYVNKGNASKLCELHRNDFIHIEVENIVGLGTPGADGNGEEPQPPVDPTIPVVEEDTNLLVNITVNPWSYGKVGVILQ